MTVSQTITTTHTTSLNVQLTTVVPAHAAVRASYGDFGYQVTYNAHVMLATYPARSGQTGPPLPADLNCADQGVQTLVTDAPTLTEGWQLSLV